MHCALYVFYEANKDDYYYYNKIWVFSQKSPCKDLLFSWGVESTKEPPPPLPPGHAPGWHNTIELFYCCGIEVQIKCLSIWAWLLLLAHQVAFGRRSSLLTTCTV